MTGKVEQLFGSGNLIRGLMAGAHHLTIPGPRLEPMENANSAARLSGGQTVVVHARSRC